MWIDDKYAKLLSSQLEGFVQKGRGIYNFRCPVCGDSKNKSKKRGYLLQKADSFVFYCHNCGSSKTFSAFLKNLAPQLWEDYNLEKYLETGNKTERRPTKTNYHKRIHRPNVFEKIQHVRYVEEARKYLNARGITSKHWNKTDLYWAPQFQHWTNSLISGKFAYPYPEKRIVIPLKDLHGNVFGFQGRSVDPFSKLKYITIKFDEDHYKLFGVDKCNFNIPYFVTEGPFDSLFLDNAIATCGGKLTEEIEKAGYNLSKAVIVYDNQPRNPEVCNNLFDAIESNYSVVIWPKYIKEKDINEMILAEIGNDIAKVNSASAYIQNIMHKNTYVGLEAHLKFIEWRKA